MISLKAFLPVLASILNISPAALYERQRALVRLKLLRPEKGRGPGSGVTLTHESVAILLIALAVTDNLSETDERVIALCRARPKSAKALPYPFENLFCEAMTKLLSSWDFASSLQEVVVDRNAISSTIKYRRGPRKVSESHFRSRADEADLWFAISTTATLRRETIVAIGRKLAEAIPAERKLDRSQSIAASVEKGRTNDWTR
jgi:hypothetical protein